MSASKKLKALDVRVRQMPQTTIESMDYHEAKNAVADALPQIVAVVEAAETARSAHRQAHHAYHRREDASATAWRVVMKKAQEADDALADALAALNEALS
jgi:hypothetical protein